MKTKLLIFLGIALVLTSFVSAHTGEDDYAHHQGMWGMMSGFYGTGFSGMWMFGWIFMGLVVVALVLLIVWLIKQIQKPNIRRR